MDEIEKAKRLQQKIVLRKLGRHLDAPRVFAGHLEAEDLLHDVLALPVDPSVVGQATAGDTSLNV